MYSEETKHPVLFISDIHVDEHEIRKLPPNETWRNVYIRLAYRIVDIAQKNNIETLFVCGDISHKYNMEPTAWNTVKLFFEILSNNFKSIYYILGNHDIKNKEAPVDANNSLIFNILSPFSNIHHISNKTVNIEGITYRGKDFVPNVINNVLCDEAVNVFVAHDDPLSHFKSQKNYDICFAGHIHNIFDNHKVHSIGSSIQTSISDNPIGTCVVFYPDKLHEKNTIPFERVNYLLPDSVEFSKFPRRYRENDSRIPKDLNITEYVVIEKKDNAVEEVKSLEEPSKVIKADEVSNEALYLIEKTYPHIHKRVIELAKDLGEKQPELLDFNFKLKKIRIQNYRTISNFEWEFNQDKHSSYLLKGDNASGKSSLLNAIFFSLAGVYKASDNTASSSVGFDKKDFRTIGSGNGSGKVYDGRPAFTDVSLVYCGSEYRIVRYMARTKGNSEFAPATVKLYINGEDSSGHGVSDTNKKIEEALPFVKDGLASLLFGADRSDPVDTILSSRMFNNKYGIDWLTILFNVAKSNLVQESTKEINEIEKRVSANTATKQLLESQISEKKKSIKDELEYLTKHSFDENTQGVIEEMSTCVLNGTNAQSRIKEITDMFGSEVNIDELNQTIQLISEKEEELKKRKEKYAEEYTKVRESLSSKLNEVNGTIKVKEMGKSSCMRNISSCESTIKTQEEILKNSYIEVECEECNHVQMVPNNKEAIARCEAIKESSSKELKKLKKMLKDTDAELEILYEQSNSLGNEISTLDARFVEPKTKLESLSSEIASFKEKYSESNIADVKSINELKGVYKECIKRCKALLKQLGFQKVSEAKEAYKKYELSKLNARDLKKEILDMTETLNAHTKSLKEEEGKLERAKMYLKEVTSYVDNLNPKKKDSIIAKARSNIAAALSDDVVKFMVSNDKLVICSPKTNMEYSNCSTGERACMRMQIIKKILAGLDGVGFLLLDEITANLDNDHSKMVVDSIKSLTSDGLVNDLFFISHKLDGDDEFSYTFYAEKDVDEAKTTYKIIDNVQA